MEDFNFLIKGHDVLIVVEEHAEDVAEFDNCDGFFDALPTHIVQNFLKEVYVVIKWTSEIKFALEINPSIGRFG